MRTPYRLGVIVCYTANTRPPFSETPFFRQLLHEGKKMGITTFIFSPKTIDWQKRAVIAWHINERGEWTHSEQKLPTLIYDRCYYTDSHIYMSHKPYVHRIIQDPDIRLLGRALGGKLQTYDILKLDSAIQPFLPLTLKYESPQDVLAFLRQHKSVLIKPNGGSHGRGVVVISQHAKGYYVRGRSKQNTSFRTLVASEEALATWVKTFIQDTRYILQPYLQLSTPDHRPFDLRILVQKNERKEWQTTGIAVRMGQPNSVTSNLHGGGQATLLQPFLEQHYPALLPTIQYNIQTISQLVPTFLEQHHGPLVELGLDVGIDRQGHVWLLEVNSKPGRTVFIKTGELDVRRRAVQLPMFYARALLMGT